TPPSSRPPWPCGGLADRHPAAAGPPRGLRAPGPGCAARATPGSRTTPCRSSPGCSSAARRPRTPTTPRSRPGGAARARECAAPTPRPMRCGTARAAADGPPAGRACPRGASPILSSRVWRGQRVMTAPGFQIPEEADDAVAAGEVVRERAPDRVAPANGEVHGRCTDGVNGGGHFDRHRRMLDGRIGIAAWLAARAAVHHRRSVHADRGGAPPVSAHTPRDPPDHDEAVGAQDVEIAPGPAVHVRRILDDLDAQPG